MREAGFPSGGRRRPASRRPFLFDVETTGVPDDYSAPAEETSNWPRVVQVAWLFLDMDAERTLDAGNRIVRPEGFKIPRGAAEVHGITSEVALREGEPIRDVLRRVGKPASEATSFVAHNLQFDRGTLGAEFVRSEMRNVLAEARGVPGECTMRETVSFCGLKQQKGGGAKFPKLGELHDRLFGREVEGAHDAAADVEALARCYVKLKKEGVL